MTTSDLFLFVSHVAEDRAAALEVVGELERRGVKCWVAPRDVRAGRPYDDEIVDAIEGSRAMLLIFSEHCNEADYIRREVTVAGESQKLIIPFRIEEVTPRRGLRVRLIDLHWIDAFVSRERAIDDVIHTIDPDGAARRERERLEEAQTLEEARKAKEAHQEATAVAARRQEEEQRAEALHREAQQREEVSRREETRKLAKAPRQAQGNRRQERDEITTAPKTTQFHDVAVPDIKATTTTQNLFKLFWKSLVFILALIATLIGLTMEVLALGAYLKAYEHWLLICLVGIPLLWGGGVIVWKMSEPKSRPQ